MKKNELVVYRPPEYYLNYSKTTNISLICNSNRMENAVLPILTLYNLLQRLRGGTNEQTTEKETEEKTYT
jgi:hypothetical protein